MKLRPIFLTALAMWAGSPLVQATPPNVAGRPVLWSVHFDAERLRSGLGKELFASIDPILTSLSGEHASTPGGKLQSLAICGFQPPKDGGGFPFLADLSFSAEGGGIAQRFQAISKKRDAPVEDLAGFPTIHFQHQGKEVWIAKFNDCRVFVSTSRALLELAVAPGADGFATALPAKPDEMLGGNVEIEPLLAGNPDLRNSELLKLLPHLEFHVLTVGGQLDVNASAELDGERSARRAARMIDGMVAALSMRDAGGVPWDERLTLKQDGPHLGMQLHLEPGEAKKLFDNFAHEIASSTQAKKDDE